MTSSQTSRVGTPSSKSSRYELRSKHLPNSESLTTSDTPNKLNSGKKSTKVSKSSSSKPSNSSILETLSPNSSKTTRTPETPNLRNNSNTSTNHTASKTSKTSRTSKLARDSASLVRKSPRNKPKARTRKVETPSYTPTQDLENDTFHNDIPETPKFSEKSIERDEARDSTPTRSKRTRSFRTSDGNIVGITPRLSRDVNDGVPLSPKTPRLYSEAPRSPLTPITPLIGRNTILSRNLVMDPHFGGLDENENMEGFSSPNSASRTPNTINKRKQRMSNGSIPSSPSFITPKKSPRRFMFHPSPLTESLKSVYNLSFQPLRKPTAHLLQENHSMISLAEQVEELSLTNFRLASYLMYGLHLLYRYKVHFISRQAERFKRDDSIFNKSGKGLSMLNLIDAKSNQQLNMPMIENEYLEDPNLILLESILPPMLQYRLVQNINQEDASNVESLRLIERFVEEEFAQWKSADSQQINSTDMVGDLLQTIETPEGPRRTSGSHMIMDLPPIDFDANLILGGDEKDFRSPSSFIRLDDRIENDVDLQFGDVPMMELGDDIYQRDMSPSLKRKRVVVDSATSIDNIIFGNWINNSESIRKKRRLLTQDPIVNKIRTSFGVVSNGDRNICKQDESIVIPESLQGFFLEGIVKERANWVQHLTAPDPSLFDVTHEDWIPEIQPMDDHRELEITVGDRIDDETNIQQNNEIRSNIENIVQKRKHVPFSNIITELNLKTRLEVSRAFYQVLVLVNDDIIEVEQNEGFGNIILS